MIDKQVLLAAWTVVGAARELLEAFDAAVAANARLLDEIDVSAFDAHGVNLKAAKGLVLALEAEAPLPDGALAALRRLLETFGSPCVATGVETAAAAALDANLRWRRASNRIAFCVRAATSGAETVIAPRGDAAPTASPIGLRTSSRVAAQAGAVLASAPAQAAAVSRNIAVTASAAQARVSASRRPASASACRASSMAQRACASANRAVATANACAWATSAACRRASSPAAAPRACVKPAFCSSAARSSAPLSASASRSAAASAPALSCAAA